MKPPLVQQKFPNVLIGLSVLVVGLVAIAIILLRGVYTAQTPLTPHAEAGWQHFEYTDSKFTYLTSPSCWFTVSAQGVTYNQSGHNSPSMPNCGPTNTQSVKFDTTGTGIAFDQIKVGYGQWSYGALIPITIDGSPFSQFDTKGAQTGPTRSLQSWSSPTFDCGEHEVSLNIDTTGRTGASVLDFAYVEVHNCGNSNATPTPTPTPEATNDNCQNNPNAPAQCFDCNNDGQINILDFSCFAKNFGQTINQ